MHTPGRNPFFERMEQEAAQRTRDQWAAQNPSGGRQPSGCTKVFVFTVAAVVIGFILLFVGALIAGAVYSIMLHH
jgi:hypothetical protein